MLTAGKSQNTTDDQLSEKFAGDYAQARQRFRQLADQAGAQRYYLDVSAGGVEGQNLTTDIAWIGKRSATRVLILQSGVHGVEAFAGSAIQCNLLGDLPIIDGDTALILVHVLNPYGMSCLRRVNGNNVDLNRNYLTAGDDYSGVSHYYRLLNRFINPVSQPGFDFFTVKAIGNVIRYGIEPLRHALAGGQYEYPNGIFFGGNVLQEELSLYRNWVLEHLVAAKKVVVIDLHTGLGKFGQQQIFNALPVTDRQRAELKKRLGDLLILDTADAGGYEVKGGISNLFAESFSHLDPVYLTVEFGTYHQFRILHALREENRGHFSPGPTGGNTASAGLKLALCPDSPIWKTKVVEQGVSLVHNLLEGLHRL